MWVYSLSGARVPVLKCKWSVVPVRLVFNLAGSGYFLVPVCINEPVNIKNVLGDFERKNGGVACKSVAM